MALETLGACDPFGIKLLFQRSWSLLVFVLVLQLDLVVDGIHQPNVELMAILVPLPLKAFRGILHVTH